jgi:hypothetical protein
MLTHQLLLLLTVAAGCVAADSELLPDIHAADTWSPAAALNVTGMQSRNLQQAAPAWPRTLFQYQTGEAFDMKKQLLSGVQTYFLSLWTNTQTTIANMNSRGLTAVCVFRWAHVWTATDCMAS